MKATKLISALHEQVENILTHQNKPQPHKAGPKKPAKVRHMVRHSEIPQGNVVTA